MIPSQQKILRLLEYNSETGLFYWRVSTSSTAQAGSVAGTKTSHGYIDIGIEGKSYKAHRLAWVYITGAWPKDEIDHRNGVRHDNSWANLREADHRLNHENIRIAMSSNHLGVLGVYQHHKKFVSRIKSHGKKFYLGIFNTSREAHEAYLSAKRKIHAGCTL